jgi:hypothetical protein
MNYERAMNYERGGIDVGLSLSLVLAAVGAILIWAVDASVSGLNLDVVGIILLIVGIVGALLSLAFWSSWGGFGGAARTEHHTTVIDDRRV